MHLVSIDDAAKNDEIVKIIKDRGNRLNKYNRLIEFCLKKMNEIRYLGYGNATFWTSGTNLGSIDGTYKYYWMGNGHKMMFNDWSIDQPNDPQHENCVALNHELNYKWDDQECDKILYSICEY